MEGYCTLNSDASFSPETKTGGFAVWIKSDNLTIKKAGAFKQPVDDSNKAEIMSVINGLHLIIKSGIKVDILVINTDNDMCRRIINKKRTNRCDSFNQLHKMLDEMCGQFPKCYAKYIKGHTNARTKRHYVNRWCDEYAGRERRKAELKYKNQ